MGIKRENRRFVVVVFSFFSFCQLNVEYDRAPIQHSFR